MAASFVLVLALIRASLPKKGVHDIIRMNYISSINADIENEQSPLLKRRNRIDMPYC